MKIPISLPDTASRMHVESCPSTNSSLKEILWHTGLAEGSLFCASFQTAGKGQQGATWESEKGKNISCSMLFYPTFIAPENQFQLSMALALGAYAFLKHYVDEGLTIKWPNDLYVHDQKIAGVLIDLASSSLAVEQLIAGVGININQRVFSGELSTKATSLHLITGDTYDLTLLVSQLQNSLWEQYVSLSQNAEHTLSSYKQQLYRREGFYPYRDEQGVFEAEIVDVNSWGHLVLRRLCGQERSYALKEVQFLQGIM